MSATRTRKRAALVLAVAGTALAGMTGIAAAGADDDGPPHTLSCDTWAACTWLTFATNDCDGGGWVSNSDGSRSCVVYSSAGRHPVVSIRSSDERHPVVSIPTRG